MSKKKDHDDEHIDETWLIPYADMLTLLLALFIVMFAMSKVDAAKMAKVAKSFNVALKGGSGILNGDSNGDSINLSDNEIVEETAMTAIKNQLEWEFSQAGYEGKFSIDLNNEGLEIDIEDIVLFELAKADIKDDSKPLLYKVATSISTLNNNIKVIGHTDNLPIKNEEFRSNWDLSAIRAINVMNYMTTEGGLSDKKIAIEAYGENKPKYDNNTEEGRAKNRRVEIVILRNFPTSNE